jgi:AraC family transcriptional regulator of adaptative response / DNA-3-methyladenine glycosylase II
VRLPHGPATVTLEPCAGHVRATLRLADIRDLAPAVARCRRLLDLDADPEAVDAVLAADPAMAGAVAKEPGVRVPRAVDGFELAVRAVVGQQISVRAARNVLAKLSWSRPGLPRPAPAGTDPATVTAGTDPATVTAGTDPAATGAGTSPERPLLVNAFPGPAEILALPDAAFAMPAARRTTLRVLAAAVADGTVRLDGDSERHEVAARLMALPGIGPWTAGYVAMRALGDPDVLLATDLAVRRGAAAVGLPDQPAALLDHAARWSPWRSYAVIRLWRNP